MVVAVFVIAAVASTLVVVVVAELDDDDDDEEDTAGAVVHAWACCGKCDSSGGIFRFPSKDGTGGNFDGTVVNILVVGERGGRRGQYC